MVASSLPQAKCTHLGLKIVLLAPETLLQHTPSFQKLKVGLLNVGRINSRLGFNAVSLGQRRCNALLLGCLQTWGTSFLLTRETKLSEQNLLQENQPTLPPRIFQFYQQQTSTVWIRPNNTESMTLYQWLVHFRQLWFQLTAFLFVLLLGPMVKATSGWKTTTAGRPSTRGSQPQYLTCHFPGLCLARQLV